MTERPKHTSRSKVSTKDKDISLEVSCVATSQQVTKNRDTSVYEIDIRSDFPYPNLRMKNVDSDSRQPKLEERKKSRGSHPMGNPFIQSHYPSFLEISSDFIDVEDKELNPASEVNMVEGESEFPAGKADKENRSPSRHSDSKFDKYIKNYIMDNFFSSKSKDLKGFFQKCESTMNDKVLHFHHHEHHHHHYYFDKSLVNQTSEKSGATKVPFEKKKRKNCERNEQSEKQEKQNVEDCLTEVKSKATFTRVNVEPDKNPKCSPVLRFKNSASVESVLYKKSEFSKSHVFSDTDLAKRDSDEVADAENFEGSLTEVSQNSRTDYDLLLSNLKNFNDLKLPVVITDQKTVPKVSYITCQCASSDFLENVSNIVLINSGKNQKKNTDEEKTSESEGSINQEGTDERTSSISSKRFRFETWTAKLKEELKEIKKELRKIEERHSKKTKSPFVHFWYGRTTRDDKTPSPNPKHSRRISVYSSKTFIVSPDDVSLNKKPECKKAEKSSEFPYDEENLFLNGTQMYQVSLGPGEGSKIIDKQFMDKEYKEYCLSKYEQTYSNGLYCFPNKILL